MLLGSLIPCLGSITFFVILFGFIVLMRYLSYRETLALAEKGLVRPPKNGSSKDTLRWGIVITGLGMALCLGMWPIGLGRGFTGSTQFPLGLGPWMLIGIVPTFFGLSLILIYLLTREGKPKDHTAEPPAHQDNLPPGDL